MARRQTLTVRAITPEERDILDVFAQSYGYRPFTERRSRILIASGEGKPPLQIAAEQGVDDETVRRAIRDFNSRGMSALIEGSPRPHRTGDRFTPGGRQRILDILRRDPRHYGFDSPEWTLELMAEAAYAEGITTSRVSDETIRLALLTDHGIRWSYFKRRLRLDKRRPPAQHQSLIGAHS